MTTEDKQAFDEYVSYLLDYYYGSDVRKTHDIKVWKAACEYKQKEIDKQEKDIIQLAEENQHYFNSLVKLEKENEELKDFLGCIREHEFNIEHGWKNAINKLFKKLKGEK